MSPANQANPLPIGLAVLLCLWALWLWWPWWPW